MNIKYIYSKAIACVCLMAGIGCTDNLDRFPLSELSPETFYSNETELKLFSNQFYKIFPHAQDVYGDNADAIIVSRLKDEVLGTRIVPADAGGTKWNFTALRNINELLAHSSNCPDKLIRARYNGLAKFFRAYFYFEKVKAYGDVPWYNKPLLSNDPDIYKPRDSRSFVMDSILADIDFAIANLPESKKDYEVTKWTALALKSRICLFEGTFRKYHAELKLPDADRFLSECIKASDRFMKEAPYSIYKKGATPYYTLFTQINIKDQNVNDEIILARDYVKGLNTHSANFYAFNRNDGAPGVNKKIINSYLMKDGSRFTDKPNFRSMEFFDEMKDRDPRLSQSIITPGYVRIGDDPSDLNNWVAPNLNVTITGYQPIKWTTEKANDNWNSSFNDIILFRTAEVYLNLAEAKAELGTITQDDINQTIKPLLDRVNMPNLDMSYANANPDSYLTSPVTGYPNVSGPNRGVILEIRRQRTIELLQEGFRYDDLMRWKEGNLLTQPMEGLYIPSVNKAYDLDDDWFNDLCIYDDTYTLAEIMKKFPGCLGYLKVGSDVELTEKTKGNLLLHGENEWVRKWDENKDYLYPIPIEEIQLTQGALVQNPGWGK